MRASLPLSTQDQREIAELLQHYERSLNSSDSEGAAACFTSDGVLMQTMLPTAEGSGLASAYAEGFAKRTLECEFTLDELVVVGEVFAYARTHSVGTITLHAGGEKLSGRRREMFIFRREEGSWRIARYLFNHDAEPAAVDLSATAPYWLASR